MSHELGPDVHAVVGDDVHRGHELDRRRGVTVAVGKRELLGALPVARELEEALGFTRKLERGLLTESECREPLAIALDGERLRDLNRSEVGRVDEDLANRHLFGRVRVGVFDFLLPLRALVEHLLARHEEVGLRRDHSVLDRRSDAEHLRDRARLVCLDGRQVSGVVRVGAVFVASHRRHRVDLTGLGVHDDCDAAARHQALHLLLQDAVDLELQRAVDAGHEAASGDRRHVLVACRRNVLTSAVHFARCPARCAGERLVVLQLETPNADSVDVDSPDDRAEALAREHSSLFADGGDADQLEVGNRLSDLAVRLAHHVGETRFLVL